MKTDGRFRGAGLRTAILPVALVVALLGAACTTDSTAPSPSLVGTWDLIGFTDMGQPR